LLAMSLCRHASERTPGPAARTAQAWWRRWQRLSSSQISGQGFPLLREAL
jgi:hypothetical protein